MKINDFHTLAMMVTDLQRQGQKIVHAHGCFDLCHVGHVAYLREASRMGDVLVVTVTSDRHVNKGPGRPMFNESQRADGIAALEFVDLVGINDTPNAVYAIEALRPDVYVKGPECRTNKTAGLLAEEEAIRAVGGRMEFTSGEIHSSTEIARKVMAIG